MERRGQRPGEENPGASAAEDRPSQSLREPRSSGTAVRSSFARSVHQHRAFLELAKIVAAGEHGVWTGALPVLLAPAGASWGIAYRINGSSLELAASEGLSMALRAHVESFDLTRDGAFAVCRAVRSRRPVSDDRLFTGVVGTKVQATLEAAGIGGGTAVPIVCGGAVYGVLLAGTPTRDPIDPEGLTFLDAAASFLAPALALTEGRSRGGLDRSSAPPRISSPVPVSRRTTDVTRVVLDAIQATSVALSRNGADVRVTHDDEAFIVGDAGELGRAVSNLLANAAEAAAERAPVAGAPSLPKRVRVSVAREGAAVAVCVEDSGRGVPHDLRARVFEAGFSTKGRGRGLGLHVVRQIALELGGHVEVAASDLGGASFRLVLPSTTARPDPSTGPVRHNSATWPQMRAVGRPRESRQAASGDQSSGDDDPEDGDWPRRAVNSW